MVLGLHIFLIGRGLKPNQKDEKVLLSVTTNIILSVKSI